MIPKFPELEQNILADWKSNNIFQKTLQQTAKGKRFVFFEGPPTANGMPHIGHVLARIFKDVICRYKTMRGFFVERKAGWDTQGLPVELEVEKQIGVSGKRDIERYGIEKFNNECKASVWKYKAEWEKMTERIGYWLDLKHPYITYQNSYIETLWWIFKQLWEKKLLFKDYKVVPHCPRCETALSSHEVAQGYKKVTENSVYVKFKIKSPNKSGAEGKIKAGDYILSWTTTPWTLPGNVALAVHSEVEYALIETDPHERIIIAAPLVEKVFGQVEVCETLKGAELVGTSYEPLFPGSIPAEANSYDNAYKVYEADFVTMNEGTGIVHTAVMYGEDDYHLGATVGLPKHHTVTPDGHFTPDVPEFAGQFVKDAKTEQAIVASLKKRQLLYKETPYEHDYPYCWRCHSPLLYYAKDSWFIAMSTLRERLMKNNEQITWVPDYIKYGRFGEWLNDIKDWAVSRERYWGTPLPIWECGECGQRTCLGSFAELAEKTGDKKITSETFDPHRPFIDELTWACQCGGTMRRVPEVADTWFDSGAMPFAQWHYPFENADRIDKGVSFPGEYIAEAIDQTRGWFYTLLAIFTALGYEQPPYKNVICLGHVLDAKGVKMSKHIGNVVDPWSAIDEYGIDPIRWYLFTVNQPGDYKRFDPEGIREVVKKNFLVLWNVVSFYKLFQTAGRPSAAKSKCKHALDRWITAKLAELETTVSLELDRYHVIEAGRAISGFIAELSTWYVRRSRDRLKSSDAGDASQVLGFVLKQVSKLIAPFTPFYAEAIYREIGGEKESVHLEAWPEIDQKLAVDPILADMNTLRKYAELSHAARSEQGIKVRQPLAELVIRTKELTPELCEILKNEVNVLKVRCDSVLPSGADWQIKEANDLAVALKITVDSALAAQGLAREVVRQVNAMRKELGLTRHNSIEIGFTGAGVRDRLADQLDQILKDTISTDCVFDASAEEKWFTKREIKSDKLTFYVGIIKSL